MDRKVISRTTRQHDRIFNMKNLKFTLGNELILLLESYDIKVIASWADNLYWQDIGQELPELSAISFMDAGPEFVFTREELDLLAKKWISEGECEELGASISEVKQSAEDIGKGWLYCPICHEAWENRSTYAMVECPQCKNKLHNPMYVPKAQNSFLTYSKLRFAILAWYSPEMDAAVMIQGNAMRKNALLGRAYGYDIDVDQAFQNARDYETEQCFINEKIIETIFEVETRDLYYQFERSALCALKVAEGYGYVPGLKGGLAVKGLPGKLTIRPQRSARTPHKGGAYNINASKALRNKLSEMQKTGNQPCRIRILPDGRVRYFFLEIPSATPGSTRGRSYVIEVDFSTGRMRAWMECYNHRGKVNRVHPKQQNGQEVISPHFPPTAKELSLYE